MPEQDLQREALKALYDLSNQQYQRSRLNWLDRPIIKQQKHKYNKYIQIKLPKILSHNSNIHVDNKQVKSKPLIFRKKANLYKQRITQILDIVQKKKSLPAYNVNKILASQINVLKQQSQNYSQLSKRQSSKSQIKRRFYTEMCEHVQMNKNTQQSGQNSRKNLRVSQYISSGPTQSLRRNQSMQIYKVISNIKKNKQNSTQQIDQIKRLITDKRNKFRKLSRQGYLIVKSQLSNSKNIINNNNKNLRSKSRKGATSLSKNGSLDNIVIVNNQANQQQKQKQLPILQISHKTINLVDKKISVPKNFLKKACTILKINDISFQNY